MHSPAPNQRAAAGRVGEAASSGERTGCYDSAPEQLLSSTRPLSDTANTAIQLGNSSHADALPGP